MTTIPSLDSIFEQASTTSSPLPLASDKQLAYIISLASQRDLAASSQTALIQHTVSLATTNPAKVTKAAASTIIDKMVRLPYLNTKTAQSPAKKVGLEPGYYTLDTDVFKVVRSPQSGNLYAKKFTPAGFEYAQGMVPKIIKGGAKLTLEEAKAYGKLYGTCVICARTLTDEQSIEIGVGPVCLAKWF
jgi:hypothetical protein